MKESELRDCGLEQVSVLLDYYGKAYSLELYGATVSVVPDINKDDTLAECESSSGFVITSTEVLVFRI